MKSKVTLFITFILVSYSFISAQIPNAGFENWDVVGNPVDWQANNAPPSYTTIIKTSDAHSDNWAVEGNVAVFSVFTVGPSLYSGTEAQGFPVNFRPAALEGYYKFAPVQDDFLQVQVHFSKNGTLIGVGANNLNPVSVYTKFSVGITFLSADIPDSALIAIFVASTTGFSHIGSKMHMDDLAWGSATDVNDNANQIPDQFILNQNYPNPFNPTTIISWQSPISSHQTLKVFDVLGNEVATLLDEYRTAGIYSIDFDASSLSSGVYFYKLQAGGLIQTKQMLLLR